MTRRLQFLFLPVLLLSSLSFLAQDDIDAYVAAKADSAWDLMLYTETRPDAMRIAYELQKIGEEQDHFKAKINAVQIIGESYYYGPHIDSAMFWFQKAYDLAVEEGDINEQAFSATSLGVSNTNFGSSDSALYWLNIAVDIREQLKDSMQLTFVLLQKAWLLNMADRHDEALAVYHHAFEIASAKDDSSHLASVYQGMGIVHKKQKNYASAEEMLMKAEEIGEATNDFYAAAASRINRALVYKSTGRYQEAYDLIVPNIPLYEDAQYTEGVMHSYGNLSVISNLLGEHERAIAEALHGLALNELVNRPNSASDFCNEMAKAHLALGAVDSADYYVQKSVEYAEQGIMLERFKDAYATQSKVYAAQGDDRKALEAYKLSVQYNDSIFEEKRVNEVLALREQFESLQKEQEIQRLENEQALEKIRQTTLIIILVVVILLSAVIINREVSRRRKARELHEAEIQLAGVEHARLEDQLAFKNRELTSSALHLAQKNELLANISNELKELERKNAENHQAGKLAQKIDFDKRIDSNWDEFTRTFTETNSSFFAELQERYGELSKSELRLAALLKMNLSSKEISSILSISEDGVKKARYRLRKKMGLETGDSLESVILSIT